MLGFVGFFPPVAFGPCISCCLISASSSCLESCCFPAGKANRSSEMRQKWALQPKSLACDFCWAVSKEASRAPALSAAGSEITQRSRSRCISTTAQSQALPALVRALRSPQRAQFATVGPVQAQSGVKERCWTWSILSGQSRRC